MENKRSSNINTIVENVRKGKWSGGNTFSLGTIQFGRRREIIQPYLHWLDERALKNSLNSFFGNWQQLSETVERICVKRNIMINADRVSSDILAAYSEEKIPLHFIYDLFNWYYFELNKVELAARKPYNSFSYKLLEKLNHPVMKVLTNHYPLKSMIMVRSLLLQLYFSYAVRKQRGNPNAEAIFEQFKFAKRQPVTKDFKEENKSQNQQVGNNGKGVDQDIKETKANGNPTENSSEKLTGEPTKGLEKNSNQQNASNGLPENPSNSQYNGGSADVNEEGSFDEGLPPGSLEDYEDSFGDQGEVLDEKSFNSGTLPNTEVSNRNPSDAQSGGQNQTSLPDNGFPNSEYFDEDNVELNSEDEENNLDEEYNLDEDYFDDYGENEDNEGGGNEMPPGDLGTGGGKGNSGLAGKDNFEFEPSNTDEGEQEGNETFEFDPDELQNKLGPENAVPVTRKGIENLLEELVNKTLGEREVMEFGAELLQDAKEIMQNVDKIMSNEECFNAWNGLAEKSGPDLHEILSKTDKNVLQQISDELKKIKLNMTGVKQSIKKLLDRSLSYFSAREEPKFEHFFDAESIDGLQEFELLHPKIRNLFIDDLLVKEPKKAGKIDVYIDISTSMREPSGLVDDDGNIITKAAFSKAILVKLKEMDMLNDLYVFNYDVYPKNNSLIDILSIEIRGSTNINSVLKSIQKTEKNSLIITDAEDDCDIYDERAFFLGVYGAKFQYFEECTRAQYALKNQWCVFDGRRVYKVNANGNPVGT